ncbi:COMM domain-containing protein 5-like [Physella acuta]|uniref:COMM domain-containing protein 5-like n=1 Tax=Physella acuta TaxID=109671 RepID=UPI0027DC54C0|nr:COMM domain-containing protein 5-like [Physella acuta]XP_059170790.1 COMM domain-containing protein 5-like [Physella acuta]XP_059170791.1 COMM domain-containing protein 5-like [Physella acuta]
MSIIQVKGAGGTVGLDRTSFVGARTPHEIQAMIKPLAKLDKLMFTKILKVIVSAILGTKPNYQSIQTLLKENLTEETFAVIYCGIDKLVRLALKIPSASLRKEYFLQDLTDLQIPAEFHEDLATCIFGPVRAQIDEQLTSDRPRFPSLEHLDWRVDVAISTGVLNRVLVRGVTMDMSLSDGSVKNFEMSVSKFQDLRFQVASVLSEMEKLEKRSILKIKD